MTPEAPNQSNVDREQLRVLSALHFIYGGLAACACLAALIFLYIGAIAVLAAAAGAPRSSAPWNAIAVGAAGCVIAAIGSGLSVLLGTAAALRILTGLALRQHRYYAFCLVVSGIMMLQIPLGALLGIASVIVLLRPSVKRLFSETADSSFSKEHGVWVLRTGQPLPWSAAGGIVQQDREARDRANLGEAG
jgi:hypothetical protein